MTVDLPVGTHLYIWGEHYEVTGHTVVDGDTPAVYVKRTSRGREKKMKIPFKTKNVLKHAHSVTLPYIAEEVA